MQKSFTGTFVGIKEGHPAFRTESGYYLFAESKQKDKVTKIPEDTKCSFEYTDSPSYITIEGDIKIIK